MPQVGWTLYYPDERGVLHPENYTFDEVLAWARSYPKGFNYTPGTLKRIRDLSEERDYLSPSMLGNCPRQVVLKRNTDFYVPIKHNWVTYRGTMAHTMLEHEEQEDGAVVEQSLNYTIDVDGQPITIHGRPDKHVGLELRAGNEYLLIDYKTVEELAAKPKVSWKWQTNVYAEMLRQNGVNVTRIIIQQIGMSDARQVEIEVLPQEVVQEYIRSRLRRHKGTYDGTFTLNNLPPVLNKEEDPDMLWLCNSGWCPVEAVCKSLRAEEARANGEEVRPVRKRRIGKRSTPSR